MLGKLYFITAKTSNVVKIKGDTIGGLVQHKTGLHCTRITFNTPNRKNRAYYKRWAVYKMCT